jgi:hypothetical protein
MSKPLNTIQIMQLNVFEDVTVLAQQQSTTIIATHYRRSDFTTTKRNDVG